MQLSIKNIDLRTARQRGSSTLEFIFCAPLLLIIMFIAMEVNERIEHRVTSAIAAGNAAWIVNADQSSLDPNAATELQNLAKADILGTRDGANVLGSPAGAMVSDGQTIMSYSENKRHANSYTSRISRSIDDDATTTANNRAGTKVGNAKLDGAAAALANAAAGLSNVVKTVSDPPASWIPSAFPAKNIEEQRLAWSISSLGTSNVALSTIEDLAKSVNGNITGDLQDPTSSKYRLLAHHSNYLRRYPGYHPRTDEYKSEAVVGLILAFDDPDHYDDFVDECFMRFDSPICGQTNGFVSYIRTIHIILTTVKTAIDTAAVACVVSSLGTGTLACFATSAQIWGVEAALTKIIDTTLDKAMEGVADKIKEKITESLGNATKGIKDKIKEKIGNFHTEISGKVDAALSEHEP